MTAAQQTTLTATDLAAGAHFLELRRGVEEVHSIVVVLRQASADGQDVGVEDDVLRVWGVGGGDGAGGCVCLQMSA